MALFIESILKGYLLNKGVNYMQEQIVIKGIAFVLRNAKDDEEIKKGIKAVMKKVGQEVGQTIPDDEIEPELAAILDMANGGFKEGLLNPNPKN